MSSRHAPSLCLERISTHPATKLSIPQHLSSFQPVEGTSRFIVIRIHTPYKPLPPAKRSRQASMEGGVVDQGAVTAIAGDLKLSAQLSVLSDEALQKRIANHEEERKVLDDELNTRIQIKKRKRIEDELNTRNKTEKLSYDQLLEEILGNYRTADEMKDRRKRVTVDGMNRLLKPAADHMRDMSKVIFEHHLTLLSTCRRREIRLRSHHNTVREILNNEAQDDSEARTAIAERLATIWDRKGGTWETNHGKSWSEQLEQHMLQEREHETLDVGDLFGRLWEKRIPAHWNKAGIVADTYGWERGLLEDLRSETDQLFAKFLERLNKLESLSTELDDVGSDLNAKIQWHCIEAFRRDSMKKSGASDYHDEPSKKKEIRHHTTVHLKHIEELSPQHDRRRRRPYLSSWHAAKGASTYTGLTGV